MADHFRARAHGGIIDPEGALRRQQGRPQGAVALPVLGWFQEGFDNADLQAARTLLDELENPAALDAALVRS